MTSTATNELGKLALIDDAKRRAALSLVPGATGPCRQRSPRVRFGCPRSSTSTTGVFVVENLNLAELAADGLTGPFALILTNPKLRGATGAWTSPIALT
jgi:hypothetical protein